MPNRRVPPRSSYTPRYPHSVSARGIRHVERPSVRYSREGLIKSEGVPIYTYRSTPAGKIVRNTPLPKLKTRRWPCAHHLTAGAATVLFVVGLFVCFSTLQTNQNARIQVAALTKQADAAQTGSGSEAVPSESKPGGRAISSFHVAADAPRLLRIPKLSVEARVQALGVTTTNQLRAPGNIYDAGWYESSAKPGDGGGNGAMLIDGHVHGPTLPGVFVNLKKLAAGDKIQVVRGDGQVFEYVVVKVQNYNATTLDMGMMLSSIKPGQPGMNLITCGGQYDTSSHEYKQRTAVFAILSS